MNLASSGSSISTSNYIHIKKHEITHYTGCVDQMELGDQRPQIRTTHPDSSELSSRKSGESIIANSENK